MVGILRTLVINFMKLYHHPYALKSILRILKLITQVHRTLFIRTWAEQRQPECDALCFLSNKYEILN